MDYRHVELEMPFRHLGGGVLNSNKLHVWNLAHMLRPEIIFGDVDVLYT